MPERPEGCFAQKVPDTFSSRGLSPGDRLTVGRFADASQAGRHSGEDVVVRCRSEESVELHCHGGADRTGTFFVLLALRQGQSWSEAMRQLSLLRFGYYSKTGSATITYSLYDFADYASQQNCPKDLKNFRQWLKSDDGRQARRRWLDRYPDRPTEQPGL